MKSILISIKPKWVAKILNGEKTIEIRKTMPKCDLPVDVYIYCTKDNKHGLYWTDRWVCVNQKGCIPSIRKGKVVAKFTLNKVEEILHRHCFVGDELKTFYFTDEIQAPSEFERLSCLTKEEIYSYCLYVGYAWHISNLVIFDEPKYLCDFWNTKKGVFCCPLTKAPQNYCYIETES